MKRTLIALLSAGLLVALMAPTAHAGRKWTASSAAPQAKPLVLKTRHAKFPGSLQVAAKQRFEVRETLRYKGRPMIVKAYVTVAVTGHRDGRKIWYSVGGRSLLEPEYTHQVRQVTLNLLRVGGPKGTKTQNATMVAGKHTAIQVAKPVKRGKSGCKVRVVGSVSWNAQGGKITKFNRLLDFSGTKLC
jgi:hypothetical protein